MKRYLILSLLAASAIAAGAQSQGYKDGIEYFKAAQYGNAKTILTNTLDQSDTDKALAYYYLGQIALNQGDRQAAKANFEKGLASNGDCAYNYVGLGALELLAGNESAANDNFKKAQSLGKKDDELTVSIARAYYNADPVKYGKELNKYLDKARKNSKYKEPSIYILEGDMLADKQDWGNAAAKYEMAITYEEDNPEGYVKYANTYFKVNKDFAISKLEELYNRAPNSALATRELAEKYYLANHWLKAADLYGKYIQNPNHFPEDKARYSVLLYWGNKYADSKNVAKEILAQDPSNFLMQRMVFLNDAALENNEDAAAEAKTFFANTDGHFSTNDFTTYADVLSKLGRNDEAVEQYELAVKNDPDNAELISELSAVYSKAKKYNQAADSYALYLSKVEEPSTNDLFGAARRYLNASATANEADSLIADEYAAKGIEFIDKAIERAQPNPVLYQFKGRLYIASNGKHVNQEAVDAYNQAVAILNENPENKNPLNADNQLQLYKEAYQFIYVYYGRDAEVKDKDKTAEYADKLKEINELIEQIPAN